MAAEPNFLGGSARKKREKEKEKEKEEEDVLVGRKRRKEEGEDDEIKSKKMSDDSQFKEKRKEEKEQEQIDKEDLKKKKSSRVSNVQQEEGLGRSESSPKIMTVREGGFFPKIGGLFKRTHETAEEQEKREEEEYQKEVKRRVRSQAQNLKREGYLRPEDDDDDQSEPFCTVSNEIAQMSKNYTFLVEKMEHLPPDIHKSIERMGIEMPLLEKHFETLLNILSFADKHVPRRRYILILVHF